MKTLLPRTLKPTTLAVSLILTQAGSVSTFADTNQAADEVLIVTANQMEQNITDTLTDVEVIEREDIERLQPQSFADLLVNIAGIDVIQKGGPGQDTSIFSRGTNSNQVLILIDGVRVGSATLGGKSVANISISQIDRVEIVKGPRAALWGSDAIGGVIQIFTRRYHNGEHRVALTLGSNNTEEVDASIGFGNEQFSNTITYGHQKTDGFDAYMDAETDDDGYQNDSLALRGDYKVSESSVIDWVAQTDQGESEFDTSWGGNILEYDNYLWNLRYSHQGDNWLNQFSASNSRDKNFTFGNGVERANADVFETRRQQYKYLTRNSFSDELSIAAGIEWLEDDVGSSTTIYSISERTTKSAHINGNYISDSFLAEVALRYDDVENVADDTTFNIGFGYRFNQDHQLSLNYGEGFKAPTFNDLYYPWGGNPNLKFETSENIELVYKGFYDSSNLMVSLFDSTVDDLIQWIPDNNGIWAPQNIGMAEISGIDTSFKISYGSFVHKLTASYINAEDAATSEQLQLRAKEHFGYDLSYAADAFDIFAQFQYVGERPDVDFQTWMPVMLDSYTQVNIGASYRFSNSWLLKLKISDAFDESPTMVSGYNSGGRLFYLTLVHQNLL
ncbi:MAG: hypothetical protein DRQ47_00695 [Gammaproteobacteria bacterium]|nr:MAG: hypothetical protein DRQ47_00695 [Gammaproteobacteria bacterium]